MDCRNDYQAKGDISMSIFGQSKKELLEWQEFILGEPSKKLYMSKKQLISSTQQIAQDSLRISNDCIRIISDTIKPDIFFSRMDLLYQHTCKLCVCEKYIKFSDALPSQALQQFSQDHFYAVQTFIKRYAQATYCKADTLKTIKGKLNQAVKFYTSLIPYFNQIEPQNIQMIENMKQSMLVDFGAS